MSAFPQFDLARTPLTRGVTLLEASAGTGKTYAIAGIVTRLVAVEGLPIGRIVVVTFTDAATAELRSRIRRRLREVLDELQRGFAKAQASRSRTVAEDATLAQKEKVLFDLVEATMTEINTEFEKQIRQYLGRYVR